MFKNANVVDISWCLIYTLDSPLDFVNLVDKGMGLVVLVYWKYVFFSLGELW